MRCDHSALFGKAYREAWKSSTEAGGRVPIPFPRRALSIILCRMNSQYSRQSLASSVSIVGAVGWGGPISEFEIRSWTVRRLAVPMTRLHSKLDAVGWRGEDTT